MNPDFEVDNDAVRDTATAVTALAGRVRGLAAAVPAIAPSPPWSAATAADAAADSARRLIDTLGHDITGAAGRLRSAATDYEEADTRAATRLRSSR